MYKVCVQDVWIQVLATVESPNFEIITGQTLKKKNRRKGYHKPIRAKLRLDACMHACVHAHTAASSIRHLQSHLQSQLQLCEGSPVCDTPVIRPRRRTRNTRNASSALAPTDVQALPNGYVTWSTLSWDRMHTETFRRKRCTKIMRS